MAHSIPVGDMVVEGLVNGRSGLRPGYVIIKDGVVESVGRGSCPEEPDRRGISP